MLPWTLEGAFDVEVAYMISKDYWGQGYGTEAARAIRNYGFEQLNLSRLICLIDKENVASIKVAQNIGMEFERSGKDEFGPYQLYSQNR